MLDPLVAKPERPVRALVPADATPRHASAVRGCPPFFSPRGRRGPWGGQARAWSSHFQTRHCLWRGLVSRGPLPAAVLLTAGWRGEDPGGERRDPILFR